MTPRAIACLAVLLGGLGLAPVASAQVDLSGSWESRLHEEWGDRFHGPDAVDFTGLPLTDDGRARALSYSSSQLAMPERQCLQYGPYYTEFGPQHLAVWMEDDPVTGRPVAYKISGAGDRLPRTIWLDGRPHPSAHGLHTADGFATGVWEGDVLTVTTTHMKATPMRRNGVFASDQTTMVEHFVRHGNMLNITAIITDPIYLAEPHVVSRSWILQPSREIDRTGGACWPTVEIARLGVPGTVPHYLPGKNPFVNEVHDRYHLPMEAILGGNETRYPEYRKQLGSYVAPERCLRYCCGWLLTAGPAGNHDAPGLNCTPPSTPTSTP